MGFLFNIFHDFVFYSADPCMTKIESVIKIDNDTKKDPLCEIHHELHQVYLNSFSLSIKPVKFKEDYNFHYKKPFIKQLSTEIFKPPKHLS